MDYTLLAELPFTDKRRQWWTLKEIKAEARLKDRKTWHPIGHWRIGQCRYNQLDWNWTDYYEFRTKAGPDFQPKTETSAC